MSTRQLYALHAQTASDGSRFPVFETEPSAKNPFPGNLAVPSERFYDALVGLINEEMEQRPQGAGYNESFPSPGNCTDSAPGSTGFCSPSCRCGQGNVSGCVDRPPTRTLCPE